MASCSSLTVVTLPSAAGATTSRRPHATASLRLPSGRGQRVSVVVRCSAAPGGLGIPGKLAELWQAARGAPPATVVAAVAAAAVIYKVASGLLARPIPPPQRRMEVAEEAPPPAPEPVQMGEITAEELRQYDGSDPEKPLLMAIKGQIYDISQSSRQAQVACSRLGMLLSAAAFSLYLATTSGTSRIFGRGRPGLSVAFALTPPGSHRLPTAQNVLWAWWTICIVCW